MYHCVSRREETVRNHTMDMEGPSGVANEATYRIQHKKDVAMYLKITEVGTTTH